MSLENWFMFVSIAFIATITPGPAVLVVSTHSATYGVKKAVMTILGNISGLLLMSSLSVAGLSTLLLYSSSVFIGIKFIGAAYLIYLGIKLWRFGFSGKQQITAVGSKNKPVSSASLYVQGLFVSLSNPKAIAFTTALFPQFIDTSQPLMGQFSILVTTFMFMSFSCLLIYGFAARNVSKTKTAEKSPNLLSKVFGSAFIMSGLVLVNTSQK